MLSSFNRASKLSLGVSLLTLLGTNAQSLSINPGFSDLIAALGNGTIVPQGPIPYTAGGSIAKRFANGWRNHKEGADRLDARHVAKRQNDSSAVQPTTITGTILVTNADANTPLGYLSGIANDFVEFYTTVATPQDPNAVKVSLPSNVVANGGAFETLPFPDAHGGFPVLGGTQGFANSDESLAIGSPSYVYLTAVNQSPANTTGNHVGNSFDTATNFDEPSQSAIWTIDSATKALSMTWHNLDGSTIVPIALDGHGESYIWTGDRSAFEGTYGATTAITYTFVPDL